MVRLIQWFHNKIRPHRVPCSSSSPEYCFPDEILIQILSKLPVDEVLLLRTVCHRWNSIISTPYFRNLHYRDTKDQPLNHNNNNRITIIVLSGSNDCLTEFGIYEGGLGLGLGLDGIIRRKKKEIRRLCLPETRSALKKPNDKLRLMGSCDGLIIFDKISYYEPREIVICNPVTRETRVIGYPIGTMGNGYICGIFYNRFQHELNLLFVWNLEVYYIFSLTQSVWSRIQITSTAPSSSPGGAKSVPPCTHVIPAVIVADALHWIVADPDGTEEFSKKIMAFKIDTKEILYFQHPVVATPRISLLNICNVCYSRFPESRDKSMELIEKDGKLCFCHTVSKFGVLDLWILEKYGDWTSWVRKYKVKLPRVAWGRCLATNTWGVRILYFPHKDVIAVKWEYHKIYLYHLVRHRFSIINDAVMLGWIGSNMTSYRFFSFDKTLLSPNIITS